MIVGERLKQIREMKNMSQGEIEKRTGLLRCYVSRVENGHTVPALETLEKMARAMDIQLYQLFFEPNGHEQPEMLKLPEQPAMKKLSRKDSSVISKLRGYVPRLKDRDKTILVNLAAKMARR